MAFFAALFVGQVPAVSISEPPTALFRLEEPLSKVFGRKVDVAPELESEVIVLHVRDVDPVTLKRKIAEAVCGRWVDSGGALTLELDTEQEQRWRDLAMVRMIEAIDLTIAEKRKALAPLNLATVYEQIQIEGYDFAEKVSSPGERWGLEVIDAIPREELARAILGEGGVFSTNPSPLEHRIPEKAKGFASKFLGEWGAVSKELKKFGYSVVPETVGFGGREEHRLPEVDGTPEFVLKIIGDARPYRESLMGMCGTGMDPYHDIWVNTKGEPIDDANLGVESHAQFLFVDTPRFETKHEKVFADARADWVKRSNAYDVELAKVGASKLRPLPREPLADLYGDSFKKLAEAEEVQLCALVSDAWLIMGESDLGGKYASRSNWHASQIWEDSNELLEWKRDGEWLTCRSWMPMWEREGRYDRRLMDRALTMMEGKRWPKLAEVIRDPAWRQFFWARKRADAMAFQGLAYWFEESRGNELAKLSADALEGFLDGRGRAFSSLSREDQEFLKGEALRPTGYLFSWSYDGGRDNVKRGLATQRLAGADWSKARVVYAVDTSEAYEAIDVEDLDMGARYYKGSRHSKPEGLKVLARTQWRRLTMKVMMGETEVCSLYGDYVEHSW